MADANRGELGEGKAERCAPSPHCEDFVQLNRATGDELAVTMPKHTATGWALIF